jgi:hypothetical protein
MNDAIASPRSNKEIDAIACTLRDVFGCLHDYVPNLVGILEVEIPKLFRDYEFAVEDDNDLKDENGNLVLGLTRFSPSQISLSLSTYRGLLKFEPRARFTAAHEMGHYFMHHAEKGMQRSSAAASKMVNKLISAERQANHFAACFLVPEYIARGFDDPSELANALCVSERMAQLRMTDLGIWPPRRPLPDLSIFAGRGR